MRALWLNKFDYSGNTESVAGLAGGLQKKGLKIHLVLNGTPPSLAGVYQEYMSKQGLHSAINISTQQIQNMLYYLNFKLLHVFHPSFFPLAQNLSRTLKIGWAASCPGSMGPGVYSALEGAIFITCPGRTLWNEMKSYFYKKKARVLLLPPGVEIPPAELSRPPGLRLLYIGSPEGRRLEIFSRLNRLVAELEDCDFGVISAQKRSGISGTLYPWTPDWDDIARSYDIIAGGGYFILRAIAKGKIALLMEEKYGGIFPSREQVQAPDSRAAFKDMGAGAVAGRGAAANANASHRGAGRGANTNRSAGTGIDVGTSTGKDPDSGTGAGIDRSGDLLARDLQGLQKLLEQPSALRRLREENRNYARENHDLEIISEQLARLYGRIL